MKNKLFVLLTFCSIHSFYFSQGGYSSGSMGMMQSQDYYDFYVKGDFSSDEEKETYRKASISQLLAADIVPEEIMNYHRHVIEMPSNGKTVNMVPTLTKHPFLQTHYLLQLGIITDTLVPKNREAIGVMYVLDISGSMGDGKLECAKKALIASLDGLSPNDYFGIVLFDDLAETYIQYGLLGKRKQEIIDKVKLLETRGSTDILAGLNQGIKDMEKVVLENVPQTLIMLTDGNTNVGETEKSKVMKEILNKTAGRIRVTTLGVGIDLHYDLLREVSEKTNGQFHYIERYEDIQKVCVTEFASIAHPIGKNVELTINLPEYFKIERIYGCEKLKVSNNTITMNLEDLNYFLTQVILIDVMMNENYSLSSAEIKTQLTYESYTTGTEEKLTPNSREVSAKVEEKLYNDLLKNFLIADWAYQFKDVTIAYRKKSNEKELRENLQLLLANPIAEYDPIKNDTDINRLKELFDKLEKLVEKV